MVFNFPEFHTGLYHVQSVDLKSPIQDSAYFINVGFLRNSFLNYIEPFLNLYQV